jgi:hypothetical protein
VRPTQNERVLDYLLRHPGTSAMTLINALAIPNYRARISDLRAMGYIIEARRDKHGLFRYRVVEEPVQMVVGL